MWTSEKEKGGQRSDTSVHEYCVQFSEFCCSLSLGAKNIFFMSFSDKCHPHSTTHTHLQVCDLQSAIIHEGHSWFISLKSLSVLLPGNLDRGSSDHTAVQLRRRPTRYSLIGRSLANNWRDATRRTWQFEGRRGATL